MTKILNIAVDAMGGEGSPKKTIDGIMHHSKSSKNINYNIFGDGKEIRELIKHIKDRGVGVLITDHNVKETLELIDRAYIMHDGKILMNGKPSEIIEDENVRRVYLGEKFNL